MVILKIKKAAFLLKMIKYFCLLSVSPRAYGKMEQVQYWGRMPVWRKRGRGWIPKRNAAIGARSALRC